MITQTACFTGPRASKMPYDEKSAHHERLEKVLKSEIIRLIREGVSEFFCGGQTGIDTLAALLVIGIKEELGTTARLHLALPYKGMQAAFSAVQKDDFGWIEKSADTVVYLGEKYAPHCYRDQNRYMVEKSDYLIAVAHAQTPRSGTQMTMGMARRKGIEVTAINPLTFEIMREPPTRPPVRF